MNRDLRTPKLWAERKVNNICKTLSWKYGLLWDSKYDSGGRTPVIPMEQ